MGRYGAWLIWSESAFSIFEPLESCSTNTSHEEVGADQFVLHKRQQSRYKDEVADACQCSSRSFLLEYVDKLGRAPETELLNATVRCTCHYSCDTEGGWQFLNDAWAFGQAALCRSPTVGDPVVTFLAEDNAAIQLAPLKSTWYSCFVKGCPASQCWFVTRWSLYVPLGFTFSSSTFCPQSVYLCVLCGSENTQRLIPYTALTDWFL